MITFIDIILNYTLPSQQCSSMDIVCMSKFLSALTAHRTAATPSLTAVLQHMKPGALLIYIDNSGGGTTQWITTEAHKANFTEVFICKCKYLLAI